MGDCYFTHHTIQKVVVLFIRVYPFLHIIDIGLL